ncbi:MAG: hypothetical protein IPJ04_17795 [Candidatus Eisenbacteria bacterium]|nr:hypothetical protein [Candidatus Eisenbacteria bacterium]
MFVSGEPPVSASSHAAMKSPVGSSVPAALPRVRDVAGDIVTGVLPIGSVPAASTCCVRTALPSVHVTHAPSAPSGIAPTPEAATGATPESDGAPASVPLEPRLADARHFGRRSVDRRVACPLARNDADRADW